MDHISNWNSYYNQIENRKAVISVDLGLEEIAPIKENPVLLKVIAAIKNPNEKGFAEAEEFNAIKGFELVLSSAIKNSGAKFAGTRMHNGSKSFYYYLSEKNSADELLKKKKDSSGEINFSWEISDDPEWEFYSDFLYPDYIKLQVTQNEKIFERLIGYGDKLTEARDVEHWLYFRNEEGRKEVIEEIDDERWDELEESYHDNSGEYPYGLYLKCYTAFSREIINEVSSRLVTLAQKNDGYYDGWETFVYKESENY